MYNKTSCRHEALTTSNFIQNLQGNKKNASDGISFLPEISYEKKIALQPATAMNMDKKTEAVDETSNSDGIFSQS